MQPTETSKVSEPPTEMARVLFLALGATSAFKLTVHMAPTDEAGLESLFWSISTPSDPEYLRFRTAEQLADLAGGSRAAVAAVGSWLRGLGGENVETSPLRDRVSAHFDDDATAGGMWSERGFPLRSLQPAGVLMVTRHSHGGGEPAPTGLSRAARGPPGYTVANQKAAYGIPIDRAATNAKTLQMVWGTGTFGYNPRELAEFRDAECPGLNLDKVHFDTKNHGGEGGDNFMEGSLDVRQIAAFGMNVSTLVSNTNTSSSTEEGDGFGYAMLEFVSQLAGRSDVPHVLSLSLGSLSAYSCELLCAQAAKGGKVGLDECRAYLQTQRQVCMFEDVAQVGAINRALQVLGARGVSVFASSGDGGSHWSFQPFSWLSRIGRALNKVGCEFQFPIYPSPSPYVTSVGGTMWEGGDGSRPVAWSGSGGGFSWQFGAPAHQQSVVSAYLERAGSGLPPAASYNASGRAYPDIAAISEDGTSQSSPTFAGIFSLVVDARLNAGLGGLGHLGPRLWKIAAAYPGEAFEDVTVGNTKTTCDNGFPAAKGWDPTTGWGRPVWKGLLTHFGSDATLRRLAAVEN